MDTFRAFCQKALIGAGAFAALSLAGSAREAYEQGTSLTLDLAFGWFVIAAAGAMGGIVFQLMSKIRRGGRRGHYMGWALSGLAVTGTLALVDGWTNGLSIEQAIAAPFGILGGLGFAFAHRRILGNRW